MLHIMNKKLMDGVSLGASVDSAALDMSSVKDTCLQITFSSGATGSIGILGSNDDANYGIVASAIAISGSAGTSMVPLSNIGFKFLKISYTRTLGTGTITVIVGGKTSVNT